MPAAATTAYTLATINNAFDYEPNPLIGLLDSHVSESPPDILIGYELNFIGRTRPLHNA
jgi:hypothetical protein